VQGIATNRKEIEMNHVHLIGYLGNDPEIQESKGTTFARLSLAVTTSYQDKAGTRHQRTDWVPVVAFRGLAKSLQALQKGARIAVYGRLQVQSFEKDGERRTSTEVIAASITFLTRAGRGASSAEEGAEGQTVEPEEPFETNDDIPY